MSSARRKGPLSAENGRRAANWGLTVGLVSVITAVIFFSLLFIPEDRSPTVSSSAGANFTEGSRRRPVTVTSRNGSAAGVREHPLPATEEDP